MEARYDGGRTTGFASPAGDSIEGVIDLSPALGLGRPSRYLWRVHHEGWEFRGVWKGDILVVDTAMGVPSGCLVIGTVHGDTALYAFQRRGALAHLLTPEGVCFPVEDTDISVWGVVDAVLRVGMAGAV